MGNGMFLELRPLWEAAAALALGLLIGLEREHARVEASENNPSAKGARTFALIALLGYASVLMGQSVPSLPLLTLAGLALLLSALHLEKIRRIHPAPGTDSQPPSPPPSRGEDVTTEVAALVCCVLGMLVHQQLGVAVMLGLFCVVVLISKPWVRQLARSVRRSELVGTLQLLLALLIVLPVVPDRALTLFPPLEGVLNPRSVVLFVLLIAGVGYVGYVLTRILGARRGLSLAGLIGGMTSSTAVTLAMGERVKENASLIAPALQGALLAYGVMMLRVLLVTMVVYPPLGMSLLVPSLLMVLGYLISFFVVLLRARKNEAIIDAGDQGAVSLSNPFEILPALKWGLLYIGVVLIAKIARTYLGVRGLYLASAAAGLADVDSIVVASSKLTQQGGEPLRVGVTAIWIAVASNTAIKTGMAWWSGGRSYGLRILLGHLPALILGALALLFLV
jgi:uncharacterized membrane protein (DUF4010 family)